MCCAGAREHADGGVAQGGATTFYPGGKANRFENGGREEFSVLPVCPRVSFTPPW